LPSSVWSALTVSLKKAELVAKRESLGMPEGQQERSFVVAGLTLVVLARQDARVEGRPDGAAVSLHSLPTRTFQDPRA
jgi:hypothetical protein